MNRPLHRLSALTAIAITGLSLAACVTILPREKPVQLYRFGVSGPGANGPTATRTPVVLIGLTLPAAARGDGILTVSGDQTAYIAGGRWVSPAAVLLQEAAVAGLEAHAPHVRIIRPGDLGATLRLQIAIRRFETAYAGAAPTVRIEGVAQLTDANGRLVATKALVASVPASANRVSQIVVAYDRAVADVLTAAGAMVEGAVVEGAGSAAP